jgi:protein SCO1/2
MRALRTRAFLAGVGFLAAGCAGRAPAQVAPTPAEQAEARDRIDRMEAYFPATPLVSHRGERVRFYDDLVRGKCVLIQFMYTTCEGT